MLFIQWKVIVHRRNILLLLDNKVFIPPSEYGEEVIDLSIHEVNVRAGYEGADWRRYKCSKM